MITYHDLKTKPKEFLAVTGLPHEEFLHLLLAFSEVYQAAYQNQTVEAKPRLRKPGGGTHAKLASMEDKLLFILTYEKTYELQTLLGLHFGLSQPQANHWIHRLMPLLQKALQQLKCAPQRDPTKLADTLHAEAVPAVVVLDGTERRRQRPKKADAQKEHYSGKKNTRRQEPVDCPTRDA
jgi:Helix-turn-helix of DDE superfamily endonuclease